MRHVNFDSSLNRENYNKEKTINRKRESIWETNYKLYINDEEHKTEPAWDNGAHDCDESKRAFKANNIIINKNHSHTVHKYNYYKSPI